MLLIRHRHSSSESRGGVPTCFRDQNRSCVACVSVCAALVQSGWRELIPLVMDTLRWLQNTIVVEISRP